jgi:hypothetical protein
MDEMDVLCALALISAFVLGGILICDLATTLQHEEDYGIGSVVTTTTAYEYLTNDTFTGVVVRGEGWSDPALTVRNRDGAERRIATEFLEPMR